MKCKILPVLLALCLVLSGCNWMDGKHVSVTPHQVHSQTGSNIKLSASNEKELKKALADLIVVGKEKGVIFVGAYNQDEVEQGMEEAVEYTLSMTPLGAYAVEAIEWDLGNSGGKPAIALEITYRRSLTELRSIRRVSGMEIARKAIEEALSDHAASLVLEVAVYEEVDISQWVEDYAQQNPQYVMEIPEVTVGVYPESGKTRIVELKFTFQNSRDNLRHMREQVGSMFAAAERYVNSDDSDSEKYSKLYAFLMGLYRSQETSITPAYSLLQHGVGDAKALTTVYAAMCRQAGLQCQTVTGTRNGEPRYWLIICDNGGYFHVDLIRNMEQGTFRRFTDGEMTGYVWDYSAYPACAGYPAPQMEENSQEQTTSEEETRPPEENFE